MTLDASKPDLKLEMVSQSRYVCAARSMVSSVADRLGFNPHACGQIGLAVDEALSNVINHGYEKQTNGLIWVQVWNEDTEPRRMRIVIEDLAPQVDPSKIRSRDLDDIRPGGLGVHIIKSVMDEAVYEQRDGGGMRLTMIKILKPEGDSTESPSESMKCESEHD